MKLITDHPKSTKKFLPPLSEWHPARPTGLAEADQRVWQTFGHGERVWMCHAPINAGFASLDPRVVLISHAPESQFMAAFRALQRGAPLPDALFCLALEGENFRGQRNRAWVALPGNLHLTAVYRADISVRDAGAGLTMLPAVAAAETIRAVTEGQVPAAIKWVNDILVDGKKVAGVLTSTQIKGNRIVGVIFGVGMNIEQAPQIDPTPFVPAATAISDHVPALSHGLPRVFWEIIMRMDRYYRALRDVGPLAVFDPYRKYADIIGRQVRLWPENMTEWRDIKPFAVGTVADMQPDLSLVLNHSREPIREGRLAYETSCHMLGL